jgi:hypothetical protein
MGKKVNKRLVSESVVKKMQRLAGMIEDDTDLFEEDSRKVIKEQFDTTSGPSAPTGAASMPGNSENVVQEADDDFEDEEYEDDDGDEDDGFGGDSFDDEAANDDEEVDLGGESDLGASSAPSLGGGGNLQAAELLQQLAKLLGLDVEIEGANDDSEMAGPGSDLPLDDTSSDPSANPMDSGMGEMDEMGAESNNGTLDVDQQRMLAEIFAKTSKQIMSQIKNKPKKK